jgi:hypothetical protein
MANDEIQERGRESSNQTITTAKQPPKDKRRMTKDKIPTFLNFLTIALPEIAHFHPQ